MMEIRAFFRSTAGGVEFRKIYNGTLQVIGNQTVVNYCEEDDNGVTKTEIRIVGDDFVAVSRTGVFSNYLEFAKNYHYTGEYLTPYGKIPVEAFTKSLEVEFEDGCPTVTAKYFSSLMGEKTENEFYLVVRKKSAK
ncbi:MAG: DUF1934 domain-containing protein [Clostridia bacterium]|nr:DUF1934 domain-containing protein [Clostridia bacterium]